MQVERVDNYVLFDHTGQIVEITEDIFKLIQSTQPAYFNLNFVHKFLKIFLLFPELIQDLKDKISLKTEENSSILVPPKKGRMVIYDDLIKIQERVNF